MINIIIQKGGKLDIIKINGDESALKWLDYRARENLIEFAPSQM